jgi:hypothetical protein
MNSAPNVKKAGNAPGGNKLIAKFPGPDFPDFVQVKGTSDKEALSGASGNWISSGKYNSPAVTLQLIKGGVVVQEDTYDANGNLANPSASIAGFAASDLVEESGITFFVIDRKLSSAASFDLGLQAAYPAGAGTTYNITDAVPAAGTYVYRIRAVFDNGTEVTLGETSINLSQVPVPDASVNGLSFSTRQTEIGVSWTSIKEVSVSRYDLDRKTGSGAYENSIQVGFPAGVGTT